MKALLSIVFCFLLSLAGNAQYLDSLWAVWNDESVADSTRLDAMTNYVVDGYLYSDPDSALILIDDAIKLSKDAGDLKYEALTIKIKGAVYYMVSDIPNALKYYNQSLELNRKLNDPVGEASVLNNIGLAHRMLGEFNKALTNHTKSLQLYVSNGNKPGEAAVLGNIAIIYFEQGEMDKGQEYYEQSMSIMEEIDDRRGIATALSNLASHFRDAGDFQKANDYSTRSWDLYKELGDQYGMGTALMSIGRDHRARGDYEQAIEHFQRALILRKQISDLHGVSETLNSMASVYDSIGDYSTSVELSTEALAIADSIGALGNVQSTSYRLYATYKAMGLFEEALQMYEKSTQLRDSLHNEEKTKELLRTEYHFESDLRHISDSLAHAKDTALLRADIEHGRTQNIYLFIGIALLIVFSIFIGNRLIVSNKRKRVIEEQKMLVEEQHKQIQSSIHYASRIQNALFSNEETWDRVSNEQFVLFKPRDVVSGDFYWAHEKDEIAIWAAADCTGHGVPGAFMSMLGVSFLNQIVTEGGETRPDLILNQLRDKIIHALEQKGMADGQKDGMDIALCSLNRKTNLLQFAGAYNPLCLLTSNPEKVSGISNRRKMEKDGKHLVVINGSKQPIGQHMKGNSPFELHEIQLEPGDALYTFSDGYADQFGGSSGKKYMTKRLYELFLSLQNQPFQEHGKLMDLEIESWMAQSGAYQVDDICIIGVRV